MSASRKKAAKRPAASPKKPRPSGTPRDLVILTGLSGSGKASALKAFEDLGFYAVDNMPVMLMRPFAELVAHSRDIRRAALVVDVREGQSLEKFPAMLREIRRTLPTSVLFLEASKAALLARYSETRRPHPLGREERVTQALQEERRLLEPIRNVADVVIDTTKSALISRTNSYSRMTARTCSSRQRALVTRKACRSTPIWFSTCVSCPTRTLFRNSAISPARIRRSKTTSSVFRSRASFLIASRT